MPKPIKAILTPKRIEMPFKTAAEQAAADKMTAEVAHLGFRSVRLVYDWGFIRAGNMRPVKMRKDPEAGRKMPHVSTLQSGDLVKIFKTVSRGTAHWSGTVNYDKKKYHHGLQKRMKPENWTVMFYDEMPAKLERDGKVIFGALEAFAETGTEGPIWSLHEWGKKGYDGLNCLQNGDKLTVYRTVHDGEIEWEGPVEFGPEEVVELDKWWEVARDAKHMDTRQWLDLTFQHRPVIVTPK